MPRVTLLNAAQKARACLRGWCCRVARLCNPTIQLAGLSKTTPALGGQECSCFIDRLGQAGIAVLRCHVNALLLSLTGAGEAPQCCCQNCHEVRAQPAAKVVIRESSNFPPSHLLTDRSAVFSRCFWICFAVITSASPVVSASSSQTV
jgi:hypothetical protein